MHYLLSGAWVAMIKEFMKTCCSSWHHGLTDRDFEFIYVKRSIFLTSRCLFSKNGFPRVVSKINSFGCSVRIKT